jgi:hypothetical protein
MIPLSCWFLSTIHVKLAIIFFLEDMIVNNYLYLSKLAAQMVTSTSLENLFCLLYEFLNQNFDFDTKKTLIILHAWSIFFNGAHLTKLWSKKLFFMKNLSKLGALTVYANINPKFRQGCCKGRRKKTKIENNWHPNDPISCVLYFVTKTFERYSSY